MCDLIPVIATVITTFFVRQRSNVFIDLLTKLHQKKMALGTLFGQQSHPRIPSDLFILAAKCMGAEWNELFRPLLMETIGFNLIHVNCSVFQLGSVMRCPVTKFFTHTTSHICFLVLLAVATFRLSEGNVSIRSTRDFHDSHNSHLTRYFRYCLSRTFFNRNNISVID